MSSGFGTTGRRIVTLTISAIATPPALAYMYQQVKTTPPSTNLSSLPKEYNHETFNSYFKDRPFTVMSRLFTASKLIAPFLLSEVIHPPSTTNELTCSAIRMKLILTSLGPAFIKIGQQLSIRPDLLPAPYLVQLGDLLDCCPGFEDDIGLRIIRKSLGDRLLEEVFVVRDTGNLHSDIKRVASASL